MNIGTRLKEERERLGYSQTAFAELGDASKGSQIAWEKGDAYPNAKFLSAIAEAGADVGYILTGTRSPPKVNESGAGYDPRRLAIFAMVEELDGEGLDHVQDAAEMAKQIKDLKYRVGEFEKRKAG